MSGWDEHARLPRSTTHSVRPLYLALRLHSHVSLQCTRRRPRQLLRRKPTSSTAPSVSPLLPHAPERPFTQQPLAGAHQNTLEWLPQVIASTLIVGVKYPCFAAAVCATWSVARVLYTIGYTSGNPKKVRPPLSRTAREPSDCVSAAAQLPRREHLQRPDDRR